MVNVEIGGKNIELLYDTGSQLSIITKTTYDTLLDKPPLIDVKQSGVGIDGHQFQFEGVAYLTMNFKKEDGTDYPLFYEPVLVSNSIKTNILGAKTEARFKTCVRDLENETLTYTTKNDEKIMVNCFKERLNVTSAYIEIAKTSIIFDKEVRMVKGRIVNAEKAKMDEEDLFSVGNCAYNDDAGYSIHDFTIENLTRQIYVPIENHSGGNLILKKGEVCAEVNGIKKVGVEVSESGSYIPKLDIEELTYGNLNPREKSQLTNILQNYDSKVNTTPINKSKIPYEHEINLTDNVPVVSQPRVVPQSKKKDIYDQIDRMLNDGIIQPSDSPYSSALVPVMKKDGSVRMCVDYRNLNSKIIPKSYPIPRQEDLFADLSGAEVFTVLDLSSANWYIALRDEDRPKTAFVLPGAKYEWTVTPFGIKDAGFSLAYVIRNILGKYYKVKMFYDDCILFGPRASHLQLVDDVLNTLAEYGIHINYKKCQFMVTECTFLGHINSQGIVPQPSKISDIVNFRKPSNLNELRTFLGMASYCRRFIKNFNRCQ